MTSHTDQKTASPMWRDLFRPAHLVHSVILGGGVVLHATNVFVSATIMPSVIEDIGGLPFYAWSTTVFVMASIIGAALTSWLYQTCGARRAYLVALGIFCAGSFLCSLATGIGMFNLGRGVQGLGGGFLYALAYTVIRAVFPQPLWPLAIGLITMMWGVATLGGPAVGGMFAQYGVWRHAFWMLIAIALFLGLLCLGALPCKGRSTTQPAPIAWVQLILALVIVALISIASASHHGAAPATALIVSLICVALLIRVEKTARATLLPKSVFRRSSALGSLYAIVAFMLVGMQPEAFVPYFLQELKGMSPLAAGYMGALMALGWTVGSGISAKFMGQKAEATLLTGAVLSFAGLCLQINFLPSIGSTKTEFTLLGAGLLLVGFGIGYCWPHLTTRIFREADPAEQDAAAAAVTTVQLLATALGAAFAGLVVNSAGMTSEVGSAGAPAAAFWLFVAFLPAPAVAAMFAMRMNRLRQRQRV